MATDSPGELGLLKALGEAFSKEMGGKTTLNWIKAGSGASLKLLKDKKVDMVMVHAPKAEKEAVQEGWATQRTLLGSNEFYIVGPSNDPAKIKEAKTAAAAYQRITQAKAKFFPGGTIPVPTKKKWLSGKKPASSLKATGMWSPRTL